MGNRKLYIGFTLAILLVMIVGGVANYTLNNQREQLEWVNHTHRVLEQTTYIERLMVDMETGRRGFPSDWRSVHTTSLRRPIFRLAALTNHAQNNVTEFDI